MAALLALAAVTGCGDGGGEEMEAPTAPPVNRAGEEPHPTLSAWRFFVGPLAELQPNEGVVPYTVAAPLWADHAEKGRFIVLPEGGKIGFVEDDHALWTWPVGSILVKSFFLSLDRREVDGEARIVETRLLRREEGGWRSFIYVWNDEQTEATLTRTGERLTLAVTDADGAQAEQTYLVPNEEECNSCHELDDTLGLLGLTTPQLNRTVEVDGQTVNQLEWMAERGMFDAPPEDVGAHRALTWPFDEAAPLEDRARAYLHGNCGHCHQEGGGGGRSGLRLVWWEEEANRLGVCKSPVAAGSGTGGRVADIVPGHPEESILIYRMSSTDPEIKMPELPNLLPDDRGVELISAWIAAMEPEGCP